MSRRPRHKATAAVPPDTGATPVQHPDGHAGRGGPAGDRWCCHGHLPRPECESDVQFVRRLLGAGLPHRFGRPIRTPCSRGWMGRCWVGCRCVRRCRAPGRPDGSDECRTESPSGQSGTARGSQRRCLLNGQHQAFIGIGAAKRSTSNSCPSGWPLSRTGSPPRCRRYGPARWRGSPATWASMGADWSGWRSAGGATVYAISMLSCILNKAVADPLFNVASYNCILRQHHSSDSLKTRCTGGAASWPSKVITPPGGKVHRIPQFAVRSRPRRPLQAPSSI